MKLSGLLAVLAAVGASADGAGTAVENTGAVREILHAWTSDGNIAKAVAQSPRSLHVHATAAVFELRAEIPAPCEWPAGIDALDVDLLTPAAGQAGPFAWPGGWAQQVAVLVPTRLNATQAARAAGKAGQALALCLFEWLKVPGSDAFAMQDPVSELPLGAVIRPQELTRGGVPAAPGQAQHGPLQAAWGSARHAAGEQPLGANATVVASYADWVHPMATSTSWAFSAQRAGPASLAGPVAAAVASRLEAWQQHLGQHWQPVSRHISVASACSGLGPCDRVLLHWVEAAGPADASATQPVPLAVGCGAPEPASVRILFHSAGGMHRVQSHGEHCVARAQQYALAPPALLPAAEPPAHATLARSLPGMGLHRTLDMRVEADIPAAAVGDGQAPGTCWLTAVHRLQRSQYFDLDELREVERYGGPALASALYAIDVERPTADSDQHVVITKQVLPWLARPLQAAAILPANCTQLQQVAWPCSNASSDADALLGASPFAADAARALRASSVSPAAAAAGQVHVVANITLPWHVRYQLQGCAAGEEQRVSSSDDLAVRAAHAWLAPAAHPDAPRQVMASCFRAVHFPLATLHVQCGDGPVVPLRAGSAWPARVRTQAGQLSAPRGWYSEQAGPAPMPVAVAAHAGIVTPATVGAALGSALLILAALRQVRTLKPE